MISKNPIDRKEFCGMGGVCEDFINTAFIYASLRLILTVFTGINTYKIVNPFLFLCNNNLL